MLSRPGNPVTHEPPSKFIRLRRGYDETPHGARWTKTFTDPRLCAAIVDRPTFGGNIIETGADSYRFAQTRARAEQAGTA